MTSFRISPFGSIRRWGAALATCAALGMASLSALAVEDHEDASDANAAADHADHGSGKVNWFHGIVGEREGLEEPSLWFRTPGMPVPLAAQVFNSFLLFYLLFRFGKQPVLNGLRQRRESIMKGMDTSAKMKAEAQASLDQYEAKLSKVDQEIERVRREMREAAEAERESILEEAKKRRERMERDAKLLIQQELKATHQALLHETVRTAVDGAESIVREKSTVSDHERLSEEYLSSLRSSIERSGLANRGSLGGAR